MLQVNAENAGPPSVYSLTQNEAHFLDYWWNVALAQLRELGGSSMSSTVTATTSSTTLFLKKRSLQVTIQLHSEGVNAAPVTPEAERRLGSGQRELPGIRADVRLGRVDNEDGDGRDVTTASSSAAGSPMVTTSMASPMVSTTYKGDDKGTEINDGKGSTGSRTKRKNQGDGDKSRRDATKDKYKGKKGSKRASEAAVKASRTDVAMPRRRCKDIRHFLTK